MSAIWIDDTYAGEGDGAVTFTLRRFGPTDRTDSVMFQTVNHYAQASLDYVFKAGTLTFAPGETVKTVQVDLVNNTSVEFGEAFELQLFSPGPGTTVGRSSAYAAIFDNDGPAGVPYIRAIDAVVNEVEATATVWFRLDRPSASAITVAWSTADSDAIAGQDFVGASGTLTFAPGDMVKPVTVTLIDDQVAEGIESLYVTLSNPTGGAIAGASPAEIRIFDSDGPPAATPLIFVDAWRSEVDALFQAFVYLNSPYSSIEERYTGIVILEALGLRFTDFSPDSFAYGLITMTLYDWVVFPLSFAIADDVTDGEDVSVYVSMNDVWAFLSKTLQVITDDEGRRPNPTVSIFDASGNEGDGVTPATLFDGFVDFMVTLSAPTELPVTVPWSTVDGTAKAGVDYVARSGEIVFAPGETVKFVRVNLIPDTEYDRWEQFQVVLGPAANAQVLDGIGVATIIDDDAPPGPPDGWIWIDEPIVGEDGVARLALRGVIGPENTAALSLQWTGEGLLRQETVRLFDGYATVDFPIPGDTVYGPGGSGLITVSTNSGTPIGNTRLAVTIVDDDGTGPTEFHLINQRVDETAGRGTVTVVRTGDASGVGSIGVTVSGGAALVGTDPDATPGLDIVLPPDASGTPPRLIVSFGSGEVVRQFWVVVPHGDGPEDDEIATVTLVDPVGGTIGDGSAQLRIGANEKPPAYGPTMVRPPAPGVFVVPATVDEFSRFVDVEVRLTAPTSETVSVDWTAVTGTADAADFVPGGGRVSILPGSLSASVRVPIVDDAVVEPDETFTVALANPTNARLTGPAAPVTIVDNDGQRGTPAISIADDAGPENIGALSFVVRLSKASDEPVRVNYATRSDTAFGGEDFGAISGVLWFAPGQVAKVLWVPVLDDALAEGDEAFFVELTDPQGATLADDLAVGTIGANDEPPPAPVILTVTDDVEPDTGEVGRGGDTNDPRPTVAGIAPAGMLVSVFDGAALVGQAVADNTGAWALTTLALAPGAHALVARATDSAGNVGPASSPFAFTLLVDAIRGTEGDDSLQGTAGDDWIDALGGRDTLEGMGGNDLLDGGAGVDVAVFPIARADAAVVREGIGIRVTGSGPGAALGSDFGVNLERLKFADTTIAIDTLAFGDNVFDVVAMHYAAFGAMPSAADLARFVPALDANPARGVADVAQAMLDFYVPGGVPDAGLVAHLYLQIFGASAPTELVSLYAGLIGTPQFPNQAALAAAAAALPENVVKFGAQIAGGVDLGGQWAI